MRKLLTLVFTLCALALFLPANAQLKTPQPSPSAQVMQTVGITDITVVYSRPGVKGRAGKIYGDLLPYGEVWRTGANATTYVEFSTDVTIAGKDVKAGKYGIFTVPAENDSEWQFALNEMWNRNIGAYDAAKDLFRVTVPVTSAPMTEWLLFTIEPKSDSEAHIIWRWEEKQMAIPVQVKTAEMVESGINQAISQGRNAYFQAATYYLNAGDFDKSIEYADAGMTSGPNAWGLWLKSRALAGKGDKKAAIATAQASIKQAKAENGPNTAFFVSDNEKNIAEWSK